VSELVRISMSLESDLLERFDQLVEQSGYPTRSEALKVLMRQRLAESQWTGNRLVAGSITMVYDHHRSGLVEKLMNVQHDFGSLIVSTQHVHLDHDHCLEILVVRGGANKIRKLVSVLNSTKGVKHNSLVITPVGDNL
jgi:CopG family nickel-responsive transcriptional regulator